MPRQCDYLYGVIRADAAKGYGPIGIDGGEVRAVPEGGIAAVAGTIDRVDFSQLSGERALQYLAEHQRVLERVMIDSPVIPLKFGTVADGDARIAGILEAGRNEFARALGTFAGKIELDVSAFWTDLQAVLAEIAREEAVVSMKNEIAARGDVSMDQRIRLGQLVKQLLDQRRGEIASELVVALRTRWPGLAVSPTHDDSVVLSAAVLIDRCDEGRFDETVEQLSRRYEDRLRFRCVGPLPPFSFATADVKTVDAGELDAARERLELGESANLVEVKAAHRRLLRQHHPDRSSDPAAADRTKDISAAYELLEQYAMNFKHTFGAGGAGAGTIIVRIRSLAELRTEPLAHAA